MQVKVAEPHCQAAVITLTVSHAETDFGTEVQCLNALIKATVPVQSHPVLLRVVRMEGPDMCIGALAAMAAYPYILLRAARLRQARVPVLVPTLVSNQPYVACTLACCNLYMAAVVVQYNIGAVSAARICQYYLPPQVAASSVFIKVLNISPNFCCQHITGMHADQELYASLDAYCVLGTFQSQHYIQQAIGW